MAHSTSQRTRRRPPRLVRRVTDELDLQFAGTFGPETIERVVVDSLEMLLPTATVTTYLPVLAEKFAGTDSRLGKVDGSLPSAMPGRAVPLRAQRRTFPDGRRLAAPPRPATRSWS